MEVAVAFSGGTLEPRVKALSAPKEMLCDVRAETRKVWVTDGAAAKLPLPDWLAVMEQVPVVSSVMVATETVQTEVFFET